MKKILVPVDFSAPSQWAIDIASAIALRANAEIVLLHVVEQPSSDSFNVEGQISDSLGLEEKVFTLQLIRKNKQRLADATQAIAAKGLAVSQVLRMGNPFHGIRTVIQTSKIDLVVMGTSGHSRLEEILIGSNTEKVVRSAKCPVLTVHQKPSGDEFKNIVYATSLSEDETGFASVVKTAQELYGAVIHLVRINTPVNFKPDSEAMVVMKAFVKKTGLKDYTLNIWNDVSEDKGILSFASTINADLIAMATHGRTGFAHVLVGSIAGDVSKKASKPVLTFVTPNLYQ